MLLANVITAFELPKNMIQERVDLLAGLFMVLATVALVGYLVLGYSSNVIAQVSKMPSRLAQG